MEEKFAVLINGEPRATNAGGGIRTYKTRERAVKENEFLKKYQKDAIIETAKVFFLDREEV